MKDLGNQEEDILNHWLNDESFCAWALSTNDIDVRKWENYFNNYPEHWELAQKAKLLIVGIDFKEMKLPKGQREMALGRLLRKLDENSAPQQIVKIRKLSNLKYVMGLVSSLLLVLISYFAYSHFVLNQEVVISTVYGQQEIVEMPDGSEITLNANSELKYLKKSPREVWLKGEGFFKIQKKENKDNFLVHTNDIVITVLGTSFNVNARNDQTKVFLEEGKVQFSPIKEEEKVIEMEPGDLVSYSAKHKKLNQSKEKASKIENTSWKDGALIFKNKPLLEALYEIEDIYGIQFVLEEEELKEERISGGVPITDLTVTIETLLNIYDLKISSKGKRYFLSN